MHACTYDICCYVWFHSFKVMSRRARCAPFHSNSQKKWMVFPIAQEVQFVQWRWRGPAALPPPCATPGSRCPPWGGPSLRAPPTTSEWWPPYPIRPAAGQRVQHVTPETTPSSQRSFLPSTQRGAHSCCPRPARTLAGLSPHSPRPSSSASRTRSSGSSCCDASDCRFHPLPTPAPVAGRWTPWATIAPLARRLESCGPAPCRSSGLWREFAVRRVHESQRTCLSAEWTWMRPS